MANVIALARAYGCYAYRRITALLQKAGWDVSVRGLRALAARGAKGSSEITETARACGWRTAPASGCDRKRRNDFVEGRTCDGKRSALNIVNEFTRECLAIKVPRAS